MSDVRLYISVASCRDWKPQFGASISGLFYHLMTKNLDGRLKAFDFQAAMQASCLSSARELALRDATERGFTHWLSLDDDMAFPMDIVEKLLKHEKPVVAANYRRKLANLVHGVCCDKECKMIDSSNKTGLEEAGYVAFGAALLDLQAIKHVPEPHFEVVWCEETRSYWTEDMVFSHKLRNNGVPLFIDHDLSKEIHHIGDFSHVFPNGVTSANLHN